MPILMTKSYKNFIDVRLLFHELSAVEFRRFFAFDGTIYVLIFFTLKRSYKICKLLIYSSHSTYHVLKYEWNRYL